MALVPGGDEDATWTWRALWLIGGLLCFRLVYTALVPIDLVHDEAYYWDWSRRLDWGYYSKPPGVAWLIALSTGIGADTEFFVRLPAVLLGTGGLIALNDLARRLFGARIGFYALAAAALTPGNAAMGLIMTIDAPLVFCWVVALLAFWQMLFARAHRDRWTILLIVATGSGFLSKQTMLAFPALAGIYLLWEPRCRPELMRARFWLYVLGSCVFLLPVVWWNAQHDWITLVHTRGHFGAESWDVWQRVVDGLAFWASQAGLVNPVFLAAFAVAMVELSRGRLDARQRFLVVFSGLPLAGVFALSATQPVGPNWAAPCYAAGTILTVAFLLRGDSRSRAAWCRRGLWTGAAMTVAIYLLPVVVPWAGLQGSRVDPLVRLWGWRTLGQRVSDSLSRLPDQEPVAVVVTTGRGLAAELAFYMPTRPATFAWNPTGEIRSQYDVWGEPDWPTYHSIVVVTPVDGEVPPGLAECCREMTDLGAVRAPIGDRRVREFRVWRGAVR